MGELDARLRRAYPAYFLAQVLPAALLFVTVPTVSFASARVQVGPTIWLTIEALVLLLICYAVARSRRTKPASWTRGPAVAGILVGVTVGFVVVASFKRQPLELLVGAFLGTVIVTAFVPWLVARAAARRVFEPYIDELASSDLDLKFPVQGSSKSLLIVHKDRVRYYKRRGAYNFTVFDYERPFDEIASMDLTTEGLVVRFEPDEDGDELVWEVALVDAQRARDVILRRSGRAAHH